jgi:transcription antitermination factor NusG
MNFDIVEIYPQKESKIAPIIKKPTTVELKWYVFYTYPRAEKVVRDDLLERNYEVYLPLITTLRLWKNRQKKLVESPLFPNYIFVKTNVNALSGISKLPKVVTYLSSGEKPSIILPKEIETIKIVLTLEQEFVVEGKFYEGKKVRIKEGPLVGNEGVLIKQTGKTRFGILLNGIKHTVLIDINTSMIESVN